MDTQTQIDRLIELAIIQRSELKQLVEQLPQLREHLNAEVEKVFDETEPQLRAELEEWTTKQTADKTAALGVALEAKIADLAKSLEVSTQARYNAIIAEREENARLAAQAEAKIAEHAASLPSAVKDIVTAELARFPRAGEIDQLRKEFAEPRGLNPRGKWQAGESYNKLDLVTINGDSYTSNTDGNRTRPSRSSADWTLVAARGTGGGGGPTSLSELTTVPSDGDVLIGSGTSWVTSNLTAGAGISITVGPGAITISATDGDITLDDGTAASPSLHFTNDPDTGIYRPAANTLGISVSGTQVAYFDEDGLTIPNAGVVAGGSIHAANGNANNPSLSFDGDQDTGFFRHQPNEIGIALGGTQYATLTSTTFSITPVVTMASSLRVNGTTDSSNKDTGAIVTEGGLGVEKSATIGGNLTVSGTGGVSISAASSGTFLGAITQNTSVNGFGGFRATNDAGGTTRSTDFAVGGTTAGGNFSNYGYISAGSALSGFRIFSGGTTLAATFDSSGNTTLAGNLTVSGTGTHSFSGQVTSFANSANTANLGSFVASNATLNSFTSYSPSASLDQKYWTWQAGTAVGDGTIRLRALNDAGTNGINALTVTRTGISSTAVAVGGNLTVSGTSSLTGNVTLGLAANLNLLGNDPSNAYIQLNNSLSSGNSKYRLTAGVNGVRQEGFSIYEVTTAATLLNLHQNGNLCLGTTNDSSNGRLQLATHTTSAGGIGFGTDLSLSRFSTSGLGINTTASTTGLLAIGNSGVTASGSAGLNLQLAVNDGYLWNRQNGPLYFGTNNTLALTLDSSQNATFAKNLTVGSGTASQNILLNGTVDNYIRWANAGNARWQLITTTSETGSNAGSDLSISRFSDAGSFLGTAFTLTRSTGNATFAGAIAIGNTVNTVSPTSPNRTITMVIGGTTYYIHAKTTND